jgi:AAA15 family ATPase/GTPase
MQVGKTSIIDSIGILGQVLLTPIMQFDIEEKFKILKELVNSESNNEEIKQILKNINSTISPKIQNSLRKKDDSKIEVELYIDSCEEDYIGFYNYSIAINGYQRKITSEKFTFKDKYRNKEKIIIDAKNIEQGQLYYINKYYNNMANINGEIEDISQDISNKLEEKYKFCNIFVKHYIEDSAIFSTGDEYNYKDLNFLDWYKKSPDFFKELIRIVDPKIVDVYLDSNSKTELLNFIMKNDSIITTDMLSTGTHRFLNMMKYALDAIDKNGILFIDEIEQNLHKGLVKLIVNLFIKMPNNNSQIIFTSHDPEIFDIYTSNEKRIFKQDSIFVINNDGNEIKIDKLIDIIINGKRVKGDALVGNLYKRGDISCHPNKPLIDEFIKNFKA